MTRADERPEQLDTPDLHRIATAAAALRDRGWRPIPLDHPALPQCAGTGARCVRHRAEDGDCPSDKRGKHPVGGWSTMAATELPDKLVERYFARAPRNIGIACGPSGLLVLDEDELGALGALAAERAEELPTTYRVRTSRGWHYYFTRPADRLIGNSPGPVLTAHHIDVRGGASRSAPHGGYVVAAGSTHATGHRYAAEDDAVIPAPAPEWILALLDADDESDPDGEDTPISRTATGGDLTRWTDEPRYGYPDQLVGQYRRHLDGVRSRGGGFRHELYLAALDAHRLVACELLTAEQMDADLVAAIARVWGAKPDADDKHIVGVEARQAAQASPWRVLPPGGVDSVEPLGGRDRTSPLAERGETVHADALGSIEAMRAGLGEDAAAELHRRTVSERAYRLRIDREAREQLAAENRAPLAVMDVDAFLDAPPPDYLVPGMFYRDGLAVVFGAPGAAKSFLLLDIGLSLAAGTAWRGAPLGRGHVHYVMAEGQATNTLRTRAWLHHREVERAELRGRFTAIVEPVMLTDAGVTDYLVRVVADQPDMIILDTKNLMFVGEESKGDAYGAMLRVLHKLRAAAGGCAVVLIDHSGLGDDTRTRGSNAQKGGVETEIRVTDDCGIRRAEVTRDKSGTVGAAWLFRLHQVAEVARPAGVAPPAVCVEVEQADLLTGGAFAGSVEDWNEVTQPPLPLDIVDYAGPGRAAIKALARFMRYSASGGVGFTLAQANRAVRERYLDDRGRARWSPDTVSRAWGALVDLRRLSVAETGSSTSRSLWVAQVDDPR